MERTLKIECGTTGYYIYEGEWDEAIEYPTPPKSPAFAYFHVDSSEKIVAIYEPDFHPDTFEMIRSDYRFDEKCKFIEIDWEEGGEVLKEFGGTLMDALLYCKDRMSEIRGEHNDQ